MTFRNSTRILATVRMGLPAAIQQSWVLIIANLLSAFLSYLFQLFMSRKLSAAEFGLLNGLMAFSLLLIIPVSTIQLTVARQTAETVVSKGYDQVRRYVRRDLRQASPLILAGFLLYVLLGPNLASFFHTSLIPIWLVGLLSLVSLYLPFADGVLQGMQWFQALAGSILVRYVGKVALGVLLVAIGLGVGGALAALVLCTLGAALYAFIIVILGQGKAEANSDAVVDSGFVGDRDLWPTLATYASVVILMNLDLSLARHYLSPTDSANYAIAALLGKIAYYLPSFLTLIIVPKVASAHVSGRPTRRYLWAGFISTVAVSTAVVLLYWLFPQQAISVLFSARYASLETSRLVFYYSLAMLILSLLYFEAHYLLARRCTKPLYVLIVAPILSLGAMIRWHDDGFHLIGAVVLGLLMGLLAINLAGFAVYGPGMAKASDLRGAKGKEIS
jgi:O-antigen/teichoic acid export membrane protein